jgi:hypothetical protein
VKNLFFTFAAQMLRPHAFLRKQNWGLSMTAKSGRIYYKKAIIAQIAGGQQASGFT